MRHDPPKPATLLNLGYLYDRAGRREEAVQMYLQLVDLAPHNADGWYNLAAIALELGQFENAAAAAQRVLAVRPEDGEAQRLLQRASDGLARPTAGRIPNAATLERCTRAKANLDAGRYEQAIIGLRVASWFDERAPLPHHYLANVYYLQGRLTDAVRHQREALRLNPERSLYRANLNALEAALAERDQTTDEHR
jgi:tetratricopeptide (TPR) repeat protein